MPYTHKKLFVSNKNYMYSIECPDKFCKSYGRMITNQVLVNDNLEYTLSIYDFISIIKHYFSEGYYLESLYFSNKLDYKCAEFYELINESDKDITQLISLLYRAAEIDLFGVSIIELKSNDNSLYIGVDGDFGVENNHNEVSLNITNLLYNERETL